MKTSNILLLFCIGILAACQSKQKSVTVLSVDDSPLIVCNETKVGSQKETKLSELIDSLQIIRLDNKDEAFFKFQWMTLSDHYICILQDGGSVKLFDKSGKFLCNVGSIGQGPGEYRLIYDALIDEKEKCIYLSSFIDESLLKYNLQGEFVKKIDFGENLNKPRLFLNPDASVSMVHLCFKDRNNRFVAANFQTAIPDSIRYTYAEELASNYKDKEGKRIGLNQEIWSYRNVDNFPFMLTSTDTLYHYNSARNEIKAHFTMQMDKEKKGDAFFIFNELPRHYMVFIIGGKGGTVLIEKESQEAFYTTLKNDFMGEMDAFPHFQDGYFFDIYEPAMLKEKLEEQLEAGDCPEEQAGKIKEFTASLNENDNNILIIGKLKK